MVTWEESFDKADGAGLGPDLDWTLNGSGWATESGRGVINLVTAAEITARPDAADVGSPAMFGELVLPDFGNASYGDIGLCIRTDATMQNMWCLKRITASGGLSQWELRKYVAGVSTTVRDINLTLALPETWRLEAEGSELRIFRNAVLLDTVTDADVATGQHGGLNGFRNSTASTRRVIFENFKIGSLLDAIASYAFDENSGGSAGSQEGVGPALTLGASTTWDSSGHTNSAIRSTVGAQNGASAVLAGPTTAVTIMSWVKPLALTAGHSQPIMMFYVDSTLSTSIALWCQRGDFGTPNVLQGNVRAGSLRSISGSALSVDTWTHVALTYDGVNLRLYKDGVEVASQAATGLISASDRFTVCGMSDYGNPANMVVDDVRVFDRALNQSSIATLMNTPVAGSEPTPPATPANLAMTSRTPTAVSLGWDTVAASDSYRIQRERWFGEGAPPP